MSPGDAKPHEASLTMFQPADVSAPAHAVRPLGAATIDPRTTAPAVAPPIVVGPGLAARVELVSSIVPGRPLRKIAAPGPAWPVERRALLSRKVVSVITTADPSVHRPPPWPDCEEAVFALIVERS